MDAPRKISKFILISDLDSEKNELLNRVDKEINDTDDDIKALILIGNFGNNIENIVKRFDGKIRVYLCAGNRDSFSKCCCEKNLIIDYIQYRHSGLRYQFGFYSKNKDPVLKFVCLNVSPDSVGNQFLKDILDKNPIDPYIVFFHLNPFLLNSSDRNEFINTIAGHNIVACLAGHSNLSTTLDLKGSTNVPIILAGGYKFALCSFDHITSDLKIEFK